MTTTLESRAESAAQVVADSYDPDRPLALYRFEVHQVTVADRLGVTEATARKYLRAAVEHGLVHEIKPRSDWEISVPGDDAWGLLAVYARLDASITLTTERPQGRRAPASLSFLASPAQLAEIVRIFTAEWQAQKDKEAQEHTERRVEERVEAQRRDPDLVDLLDLLAVVLPDSDVRALTPKRGNAVVPVLDISRRDTAAFKDVLRRALGPRPARTGEADMCGKDLGADGKCVHPAGHDGDCCPFACTDPAPTTQES